MERNTQKRGTRTYRGSQENFAGGRCCPKVDIRYRNSLNRTRLERVDGKRSWDREDRNGGRPCQECENGSYFGPRDHVPVKESRRVAENTEQRVETIQCQCCAPDREPEVLVVCFGNTQSHSELDEEDNSGDNKQGLFLVGYYVSCDGRRAIGRLVMKMATVKVVYERQDKANEEEHQHLRSSNNRNLTSWEAQRQRLESNMKYLRNRKNYQRRHTFVLRCVRHLL